MAKYSSTSTTVSIEDSPGGTARVITAHVDSISGLAIESITEQSNPFGSTGEGHTPVGMVKTPDIVLSGIYDTAATTGSWTVLKQVAGDIAVASVGRELVVVAATGATFTISVHLIKTEVLVSNGKLTRYATTLRPATPYDGVWS